MNHYAAKHNLGGNVRRIFLLFSIFLLLGGCAGKLQKAELEGNVMSSLQGAIFEVVVPKPTKDSLSYAKPLPMDLLPYAIRTDKYYSIGTAFAIAPDRFLTAAHVLNMDMGSQFREIFLRDRKGSVYPVDQIFKYSDNKDFAVFSLKGKAADEVLPVNPSPRMNEKVYAVGNALGEGIVIRDGLYTSDTPEELEGKWKWLRFSAAASPGNSGGPLLDRQGKVIGVVLRKSENENLNFALPISEVLQSPENMASVHKRMVYSLDNMEMRKWGTLDEEIPLPKNYSELNRELVKANNGFANQLLKDLLAENQADIFPNGKGSDILLNQTYTAIFPHLIMKGGDGNWGPYYPEETTKADIGHNGTVTYGKLGNSVFARIIKPDDINLEQFYNDSKLFMDFMLQGVYSTREVGPEKIKITSLGKAQEEYVFTDSYLRKWLVKTWLLEYSDRKIVTFSLPVPGGCVTLLRSDQTGRVDGGHIPDLKVLTDFIYVSYYGTFGQWRELLAMKDFLPAAFSNIKMTFDYNKKFKYHSKRVSFFYDPSIIKIDDASDLQLRFSYFRENDRVVWDVSDILVGDDKNNENLFKISRNIRPPEELSDDYRSDWQNIINRRFPYDRTVFFKDEKTIVGNVFDQNLHQSQLLKNPIIYTVVHSMDGNSDKVKMGERLDHLMHNMQVFEY